jgi:hypothetical protein
LSIKPNSSTHSFDARTTFEGGQGRYTIQSQIARRGWRRLHGIAGIYSPITLLGKCRNNFDIIQLPDLHAYDMLRKYTDREHYEKFDPSFVNSKLEIFRTHLGKLEEVLFFAIYEPRYSQIIVWK